MEITRSREHTVNLGNYESVKVGASVTLNDTDILAIGGKPGEVERHADGLLDSLLKRDLDEALANVPSGKESHLETWGN